jgi:hypothetical protein
MTGKRKFWWSELSKWDDHVEKEWIQCIELVAGVSDDRVDVEPSGCVGR